MLTSTGPRACVWSREAEAGTTKDKKRPEYLRPVNLDAVRRETANFKRFRKLVDRWVALALQLSQLKTRQGLHSDSQ